MPQSIREDLPAEHIRGFNCEFTFSVALNFPELTITLWSQVINVTDRQATCEIPENMCHSIMGDQENDILSHNSFRRFIKGNLPQVSQLLSWSFGQTDNQWVCHPASPLISRSDSLLINKTTRYSDVCVQRYQFSILVTATLNTRGDSLVGSKLL